VGAKEYRITANRWVQLNTGLGPAGEFKGIQANGKQVSAKEYRLTANRGVQRNTGCTTALTGRARVGQEIHSSAVITGWLTCHSSP
jgi:hypothetical protein